MVRYTLVYDAGCGPCKSFRRTIDALDSYGRFAYEPLKQAEEEGRLDAIPAELRHRSFHLVSASGVALSGASAIPVLVGQLPGGSVASRLVVSAPGGTRAIGFVYSVLSRLHDSGKCQSDANGFRPMEGEKGRW